MSSEINPWPSTLDTIDLAEQYLIKFGYANSTKMYYRNTWKQLAQFIHHNPTLEHASVRTQSPKFLNSRGITSLNTSEISWSEGQARRSLQMLTTLQETGCFRPYRKRVAPPRVSPTYQRSLDQYLDFCRDKLDLKQSTIVSKERILMIFTSFLSGSAVASPADITKIEIADFIKLRSTRRQARTLSGEVGVLRGYFRFLCMQGSLDSSILLHLRSIRFSSEHHLPSVWPSSTVESFLKAIDRQTSVGKRDYAMLLLAARLGLRSIDIVSLKLDSIDWPECRLKFTQSKTQRHLSLPLVNDVANAIIDYLQSARPDSEHREVFLKTRAPHGPLKSAGTFYWIIKSAKKKANIKLAAGMPRGVHALRHTLATNLLKQGQSMESIASVLGHSSIESTRIYTHVDVDALRSVALEVCDA